jgi:hypothetical protein
LGKDWQGMGYIHICRCNPEDLAEETDTLIKVAEQRLMKFPKDKVPYNTSH